MESLPKPTTLKYLRFADMVAAHVDDVGITSISIIALVFRENYQRIRRVCDFLVGEARVIQPRRGLIVSRKWIHDNPEHAKWVSGAMPKPFIKTNKQGDIRLCL
jgi:hypothetical protein